MYDVTLEINSETTGVNFIDVGIHENVKLTNVEYKESTEGNKFMVFTFEKEGKTLPHTEWEPKDPDPVKLKNKKANQMKRVKHIVTKFIPEEAYVFKAEDFKSFCENTIKLLDDKFNNKLVRIKVVYSNNNYTSLPNYVPFIESMDVPKEKSKLEIISIDKMKRDRVDNEPKVESNPFAGTESNDTQSETTGGTEGLPF